LPLGQRAVSTANPGQFTCGIHACNRSELPFTDANESIRQLATKRECELHVWFQPETARKQIIESQGGLATGRFTRPEEVADLVLLLASGRAGNVTGSDFVINGGLIKPL